MRPFHLPMLGLILTLSAAPAPARADADSGAAGDLPRYNLPVGRKLTYTVAAESRDVGGANMGTHGSKGTFTVTVLRENPDGSRRVALRSASTFTLSNQGKSHDMPERVTLAYGDVFPDGRVTPNPTLGMQVDPSTVLPLLPSDANQLAQGWTHRDDAKQQQTNFIADKSAGTGSGAGAGEFVFVGEQAGVMNKIYEMTNRGTYHFDRGKGCITRVVSETSQGYGFKMKGTGETTLQSDETIAADEVATLAADYESLFGARDAYTSRMQEVSRRPDVADATLAAAKSDLAKARDAAKSEAIRAEFDKMLENHDEYEKYAREEATRLKDVLNKPSPDWSSTDIDGKPANLADYRGKVVLMDFWYRGCGWCIYAMPQVIQLANDYAGKPVAVLGMNTDQKEEDARFVIDAFALKYPTIKAEGIPPKYGVRGFPTLVILDQQGVVRDVHVGYSPKLREEVGKKIDELLKEPAKPST